MAAGASRVSAVLIRRVRKKGRAVGSLDGMERPVTKKKDRVWF
jgi:hypothetical protein